MDLRARPVSSHYRLILFARKRHEPRGLHVNNSLRGVIPTGVKIRCGFSSAGDRN